MLRFYAFIIFLCFSSLSLSALDSDWQPYKFEYDITKVPAQYKESFIRAFESWKKLKQSETEFFKELRLAGGNQPYYVSVDNQLTAFTHPWDLDVEYPFRGGYGESLANYQGYKKIEGLEPIEGSLEAVFTDGLTDEQYLSEKNPVHIHIKKDAGEVTLLLSADGNADWDISWDNGVNVKKIIMVNSLFKQRIKTQSPLSNIIKSQNKIGEENLFKNKRRNLQDIDNYLDYMDRTASAVGSTPRNIRFNIGAKGVQIDGSILSLDSPWTAENLLKDITYIEQTEASSESFATIKTSDNQWAGEYLKIEDNRRSGKWYWEAKLDELSPVNVGDCQTASNTFH